MAALADAHDEHMLLVRMADKDKVDKCELQQELFRHLGTAGKEFELRQVIVTCFLRFVSRVTFLFTKGKLWQTKGTYGHFLLQLSHISTHLFDANRGFSPSEEPVLKRQPLVLHKPDGSVFRIGGPDQITEGLLRRVMARLHNCTVLVKDVINAELPAFEVFSSMTSLMQLDEGGQADFEDAASRMGKVLGVSAVALTS